VSFLRCFALAGLVAVGPILSIAAGQDASPATSAASPAASISAKDSVKEDDAKPSSEPSIALDSATQERGANLLGQTDTSKGEARRNENVQINLVDTNAAREMNARIGTTATIIEEFHPDRGYYATEYGNSTRNLIHAQPQIGSGFHGNLFWTHNNSIFSARSFFQVGSVLPARQNQYGASFSTALWKGGFFSFIGSQDKNRGNVNGNVLVPLPSERTPLATDPAVRAIVQRLLDAYPNEAPNRPDIAARALNTNSLQSVNTNSATGQLNQRVNGRDALAFRYGFTSQQVNAFQLVTGQNPNTDNKSHNARITWNRVWSAATVMDASMGFDRQGTLLLPTGDAVGPVYLNGLTILGPQSNIPLNRALNTFRYAGSVQHRHGQHAISAGFGASRQQYNGFETEGSRPTLQFRDDFGQSMITNLLMGMPSTYTQAFGQGPRGFRNWELQAFAGDHWTVSRNLTLNYGIRWEPWTRPVDVLGISHLNFDSDWNNVGGNAGFAYRLPKGVLRGAFAVLHGQVYPVTYGQDRFNPPTAFYVGTQAPNILDPLAGLSEADLSGKGRTIRFDLDPNLATPYSYQYNFSWENEFSPGWKLQLGYVGSRTHKLFHTFQLNRAVDVPGIPFNTATTNLRRPDQTLFQRFYTLNASLAYYDAGRATLIVPRWHGATLTASYWFSKSIGEAAAKPKPAYKRTSAG